MTAVLHPFPYIRWTYRQAVAVSDKTVDQLLGISTTFPPPTGLMAECERTAMVSKPFGWFSFYRVFRTLQIGAEDAFLDLGAGAGRASICASFLPFRRVIGIEIDPEMHRRAEQNRSSLRLRNRERISFICTDASAYRIPDDITVVFMYNPFGGEIFEKTMAGIFASLDRAPRRLRLVYSYPKEKARLERTGRCRLVRQFRGMRPGQDWAFMLSTNVYELLPAAAANPLPGDAALTRPGVPAPAATGKR